MEFLVVSKPKISKYVNDEKRIIDQMSYSIYGTSFWYWSTASLLAWILLCYFAHKTLYKIIKYKMPSKIKKAKMKPNEIKCGILNGTENGRSIALLMGDNPYIFRHQIWMWIVKFLKPKWALEWVNRRAFYVCNDIKCNDKPTKNRNIRILRVECEKPNL